MNIVDAAQQRGLNPKYVATTQGGEYHASCPECGGKDRFILNPNRKAKNCIGTYYCRQCGSKEISGTQGDFIEFCRKYLNCSTFEEAVACASGTMPFTGKKSAIKKQMKTMQHNKIQAIIPDSKESIILQVKSSMKCITL